MKSITLVVAAVSLLQLSAAQPHRRRHVHERAHKNIKKDDDDVVVTVVDTVYAMATEVPEVIVYVDQDGTPFSTTTEDFVPAPASLYSTAFGTASIPSPSSIPSSSSSTSSQSIAPPLSAAAPAEAQQAVSSSSSSSSSTPAATPVSVAPVASTPSTVAPAPVASTSESPAPAPVATSATQVVSSAPSTSSTSSSSSEGSGFGLSYSPYNSDQSCKTQDQVNQDFAAIGSGYSIVRTYGTDCNQVATVLSAAKTYGMKMFAGIFDLNSLSSEVAIIAAAANGDWSSFDTISIGNELVNDGTASAATVVAAIGTARGLLKAAGYTGKVVTVDTLVAARANPSLCDASDYCAVNSHPFFDGNTVAADSGKFLTEQVPTLQAVLANKNQQVVITETGWPWKGETNGAAVPSLANQAAALSSIKTAYASSPESVILFTAFNDLWKSNTAAQFQAEQYWGMGGNNPPSG